MLALLVILLLIFLLFGGARFHRSGYAWDPITVLIAIIVVILLLSLVGVV